MSIYDDLIPNSGGGNFSDEENKKKYGIYSDLVKPSQVAAVEQKQKTLPQKAWETVTNVFKKKDEPVAQPVVETKKNPQEPLVAPTSQSNIPQSSLMKLNLDKEGNIVVAPSVQESINYLGTETLSQGKTPTTWDNIIKFLSKPFQASDAELIAKASVAVAVRNEFASKFNVDPNQIDLAQVNDNLDTYTKELGVRSQLNNKEFTELMFTLLMPTLSVGIPLVKVATSIGKFALYSTAIDGTISAVSGKPMGQGLGSFLPENTSTDTKNLVDLVDLMGKIFVTHQMGKVEPQIADFLTKQKIVEYKLPRSIAIDPATIKDIHQTGKMATPEQLAYLNDFQADMAKRGVKFDWREAQKSGVEINIPSEKIVTITDKPYWSKLKSIIGLPKTEPISVTSYPEGAPTGGTAQPQPQQIPSGQEAKVLTPREKALAGVKESKVLPEVDAQRVAQGWAGGDLQKKAFDSAMFHKDVATVKKMLPDVPQAYKDSFAKEISALVGETPVTGGLKATVEARKTLSTAMINEALQKYDNAPVKEGFTRTYQVIEKGKSTNLVFDNENQFRTFIGSDDLSTSDINIRDVPTNQLETTSQKGIFRLKGVETPKTTKEPAQPIVEAEKVSPQAVSTPLEPLANEARKYKSAEEFVKAQGKEVYHAGNLDIIENRPTHFGSYEQANERLGNLKEWGQTTGKEQVKPYVITGKFKRVEDLGGNPKAWEEAAVKAKEEGYSGFVYKNEFESAGNKDSYVVFNSDQVKTKSQLTDIYNQAKGGVEKPKPAPITKTARKMAETAKEPVKVVEAPKVEPKKELPASTGEKTIDKKFQSRVFERLKMENPQLEGDLGYDPIKLDNESEKAVELLATDKQKAFNIAMNVEPSSAITSTSVNIAMADKALEEGNNALYNKLIVNRSLAQTRRGQEIVSEKASITDNSTARYVKELISTRLDSVGKKYLSDLTVKKVGSKEQATKVIDREVVKVQNKIKNKKLDVKTALKLLEELTCV